MTTGNVDNWDGNIFDIGPIYPFVGWEVPMVILCLLDRLAHLQIREENKRYEEQARALRQSGALQKALADEHTLERHVAFRAPLAQWRRPAFFECVTHDAKTTTQCRFLCIQKNFLLVDFLASWQHAAT